MKTTHTTVATAALCFSLLLPLARLAAAEEGAAAQTRRTRVLIITGGHDFEKGPFFKLFEDNPRITFQAVEHPKAHEMFRPQNADQYDVIVLYDMWAKISEEAKADFIDRLKDGKGLVALHHCLASYQDWEEYAKIIGGKFYLQKRTVNGVENQGSVYKHGVDFTVRIADPRQRVTRGLQDFAIHDETYGQFEVHPDVTPLLTTTEATSGKTIAWTHTYGRARVVYIQLGHDHFAYENPNYRRLLAQAIRYVAPRRAAVNTSAANRSN